MSAHSPARDGWLWPAEWERHRATWLSWPHNPETWPGRLAAAIEAFVAIVRALQGRESVCINVADGAMEAAARRALAQGGVEDDADVRFFAIPTNDAWVRDHGPLFVVRDRVDRRERALLDFRFDAWGRKYPPWQDDDAVPRRIAAALELPVFASDVVLEGGSIDGNGAGTVLTTESCLLNPNRGAHRSREEIERLLHEQLGAKRVLWLGEGIVGDDTDGHVDDLTRFVDRGTVVTVVEPDVSDPNHAPLAANRRRLRAMRDQDDKPLAIAELPMPPPIVVGGQRCPASYANFYLANGVALVPTFGVASDGRALSLLRELLPDRDVIGISCRDLVVGLGAIHCVTQQEPA